MRKIPTLYERDWDRDKSRVVNKVTPGCEWVLAGEGIATRKLDGCAALVVGGKLYKRHDAKAAPLAPDGFIEAQPRFVNFAGVTHWPGWIPVTEAKGDRWYREAAANWSPVSTPAASGDWEADVTNLPEGTYELLGPRINGNPEAREYHVLEPHGAIWLEGVPLDFEGLGRYFLDHPFEGIVWWRRAGDIDGGLAKIKATDFGIRRRRSSRARAATH